MEGKMMMKDKEMEKMKEMMMEKKEMAKMKKKRKMVASVAMAMMKK